MPGKKVWLLDKEGNPIGIDEALPELINKDNRTSAFVVSGFTDTDIVHLDAQAIAAASTAFMLIDLSDKTNWPHAYTGHIVIEYIIIEVDPADNYLGEIKFGFLSNVDAANGDFHQVIDIDMARKSSLLVETIDFGSHGLDLRTNHWFGPTTSDSALFQTAGADIVGPDSNSFPSGDGDLVMIVEVAAQSVDVSVTVGYETIA